MRTSTALKVSGLAMQERKTGQLSRQSRSVILTHRELALISNEIVFLCVVMKLSPTPYTFKNWVYWARHITLHSNVLCSPHGHGLHHFNQSSVWTSSLNLRIPKFSRKIPWLERGFGGTWWSTWRLWSEHFFHVGEKTGSAHSLSSGWR